MVRSVGTRHELPPNPTFKTFERSDGSQTTWPTNTTRVVDREGHVNFMDPVTLDLPIAIKWRVQIAEALANALKWPKGPSYVLQDWPTGYAMFDHNKGPAENPRHDIYLFGPRKVPKFRSTPEFIPHAIWLFTDPTLNNANCQCKYCGKKKSQREITASMGESGILPISPGSSPGPPARRVQQPRRSDNQPHRGSNLRQPAVHASIQRKARIKSPSSHLVPGAMVVERDADLRAIYAQTEMKLKRWLREDEVVWCALKTPIPGPRGESDSIRFWPGVVDENRVKSEAFPLTQPAGPSNHSYDPEKPPWKVKQYTMYKVKLLATQHILHLPDDQVLPYLAYLPSPDLINALQNISPESMKYSDEYTSTFNPCPEAPDSLPVFVDAAGPLALAIEIASIVAHYWGLSDDWEFQYTVPVSSNTHSSSSSGPRTLAEVLSAASSSNAKSSSHTSYTSYNTPISTNRPNVPLEQVAPKMIGPPPFAGHSFQQTRFQGLWWGCERIWVNDFIRVKLTREAIAPNGAPHILPAAGPGMHWAKVCQEEGRDLQKAGAVTRGTFMRLDSLFVVDVASANGKKKECRASGMLYELVDEDWGDETDNSKGANGVAPASQPPNGSSTTSLPHASPLKPSALPNPDPAVPIDEISPRMNTLTLPNSQSSTAPSKVSSRNPAGQGPSGQVEWVPPEAPKGFRFRPILEDGFEAVFSLTLISGRYYPGITEHPILEEYYRDSINDFREGKLDFSAHSHLWTLEGLLPGALLAMDPIQFKKDRTKMFEDGHLVATKDLDEHLANRLKEEVEDDVKVEHDMEVDVDDIAESSYVGMDVDQQT
ncbi:hypothetical protein K435DRAFT_749121 [Dendrothele bispora CBS 962.96]|uniref:Cryptic loci regulator 2 N-terminal domain-containing protein n=1 Tax=Dendrothele bispora (strain CBS 962.96) TaxID=1314807 RepID=A0A4S8MIA7_DENBC|nr:hypothetical protein K435DRAFT_749121 [Dendrothele bispora CBS 962.96]